MFDLDGRRDPGAEQRTDRRLRRRRCPRPTSTRRSARRRTASSSGSSRAGGALRAASSRRDDPLVECVNLAIAALTAGRDPPGPPGRVAGRLPGRAHGSRRELPPPRRSRRRSHRSRCRGTTGGRGSWGETAASCRLDRASTIRLLHRAHRHRRPSPGSRTSSARVLQLGGEKESSSAYQEGLPGIGQAFLVNIQIFLIAEAIVLVLALVVAVVRSLPGPVFFPRPDPRDRVHRPLPRDPTAPRDLRSSGSGRRRSASGVSPRNPRFFWAACLGARPTRRTSPRCTGPGSSPCTRARSPPRARSG